MKYGGFDGREAKQPVVQHLLEDFEIAEECGGRLAVAVQARGVGIGLKRGDAVGQGGVGRVVSVVAAGQDAEPHGGVDIGRQAIPERAEKGVEV